MSSYARPFEQLEIPAAAPCRCLAIELVTWFGIAVGALGFFRGAAIAAGPGPDADRPIVRAAPARIDPDRILAWVTMGCGATTMVVNTCFHVYRQFRDGRKPRARPRPRPRHKDSPDGRPDG